MRSNLLRRPTAVALALLVGGALAACEPTGNARCDALGAQRVAAERLDYPIKCDAKVEGVANDGRSVLGWTDHENRTIWLWPTKMTDDRVLRKVAWHELGHVAWDVLGRKGTQADEERWADGFAYCSEPIKGVSYSSRPGSCKGYRIP